MGTYDPPDSENTHIPQSGSSISGDPPDMENTHIIFKTLHRCIVICIKLDSMIDMMPDTQTSYDGRGTMTDNDRQ